MRIVHITPDYAPARGGAELYVKEISERLAARGHEVMVLAMNSRALKGEGGRRLRSSEQINGVRVIRLHNTYRLHRRLLSIRGAHRALSLTFGHDRAQMLSIAPCSPRAFLATLRAQSDVVAVINFYHETLAYQTAIVRAMRDFAFVGIPLFHIERPWAASPLFGAILSRCDAVVAMTNHEKRFVEQRSRRCDVHVVGAGVDPASFSRADGRRIRERHGIGDAPVVGYVGRISASKGVVTLIEAMKIVWRQNPDVRLLLAGSGLPSSGRGEDAVRRAFETLPDAEKLRVVALESFEDEEKASIFDAIDVFAMASVAESFGIAYLEAWMCGKAVIGSRGGSTEYVVDDGIDGLLVSPGEPSSLADAILTLLADPQRRARMGQAGRAKTLASFTWDRIADRVEAAYRQTHERVASRRSEGSAA